MIRRKRVLVMALAFTLAACGTQALGGPSASPSIPTASASPAPASTAAARPTNATSDVLYVEQAGSESQVAANGQPRIDVIDARTGRVLREMPDGVVSADRKLLYTAESIDGDTRTIVRVLDLATGAEERSIAVPGYYQSIGGSTFAARPLTPDSRWLVLSRQPVQQDGRWISRFAVVDTVTKTSTPIELEDTSSYGLFAPSRDGRTLDLWAVRQGAASTLRALDVATKSLSDVHGWDGQNGFQTPAVSAEGRLWSIVASGRPFVLAVDPATSVARTIALPATQGSRDFESSLMWSLALTPDGRTAYAVNPVLGAIDELDLAHLSMLRSSRLKSREPNVGVTARLLQMVFPVADAKEMLRTGALLSPDGRTLYAAGTAAGTTGISVIDTATLALRDTWAASARIGSLALSPDGARLYAVNDGDEGPPYGSQAGLRILDAHDGSTLGNIDARSFATIVRVDLP